MSFLLKFILAFLIGVPVQFGIGWSVPDDIDGAKSRISSRSTIVAAKSESESGLNKGPAEKWWRSQELSLLAVALGVGDVDGDGKNEIVVAGPSTIYLYRFSDNNLSLITEYSSGNLEIKSLDVAKTAKNGRARIYVSAQNRGSVASFVLEYKNGALVPAVESVDYFLRVINYPTHGPILLGQKKRTDQNVRRSYLQNGGQRIITRSQRTFRRTSENSNFWFYNWRFCRETQPTDSGL